MGQSSITVCNVQRNNDKVFCIRTTILCDAIKEFGHNILQETDAGWLSRGSGDDAVAAALISQCCHPTLVPVHSMACG